MKYTKNCLPRRGKKSFSDLFERLIDGNIHNGIDALKKIRGSIEFDQEIKDKILTDIAFKRD
jgi:predicted CopG family antitoxin